MASTKIEWTESTWNPVTGCTKISAGCVNCYAERMAYRLQAMKQDNYRNGFEVTLQPEMLNYPLKWKKPQVIFVNSMSDLFHEDVPVDYIRQVFNIMKRANWHTFQVLTKRAERLSELSSSLIWPDNVWVGVTVENQDCVGRIDYLRRIPAAVRFLSMEPLLSSVSNMNLTNIDWVIVGGESGPGARAIEEKWIIDIRDQCKKSAVAFFFKQWGGINKKKAGRLLDGKIYDEMPEASLVV